MFAGMSTTFAKKLPSCVNITSPILKITPCNTASDASFSKASFLAYLWKKKSSAVFRRICSLSAAERKSNLSRTTPMLSS